MDLFANIVILVLGTLRTTQNCWKWLQCIFGACAPAASVNPNGVVVLLLYAKRWYNEQQTVGLLTWPKNRSGKKKLPKMLKRSI